mmetsp:Transcript_25426/g.73553  ORF Transcript_25426/g.73553 Transcript_25426/m.73553 type:complete len:259 (+) Transcript_25426:1100-1876(+)
MKICVRLINRVSQLEVKILQDLKEFGSNVSRVLGDRSNAHSLGSIHGHFVRNVIQILSRLESGVAIPKDAHPLPKGHISGNLGIICAPHCLEKGFPLLPKARSHKNALASASVPAIGHDDAGPVTSVRCRRHAIDFGSIFDAQISKSDHLSHVRLKVVARWKVLGGDVHHGDGCLEEAMPIVAEGVLLVAAPLVDGYELSESWELSPERPSNVGLFENGVRVAKLLQMQAHLDAASASADDEVVDVVIVEVDVTFAGR